MITFNGTAKLYSADGEYLGELSNLYISFRQLDMPLSLYQQAMKDVGESFDHLRRGLCSAIGSFKLLSATPAFVEAAVREAAKARRKKRHEARFQRIGSQQKKRGRR